ncbi:hypothetical protein P405_13560 [Streptomyces sp. FR-008]|nr:hypothetical protein SFR_1269 [Streptomyces sp. FR-008]KAF0791002.1 hypothetical protein P405_13560 [Streptomyces sp. FR-008]
MLQPVILTADQDVLLGFYAKSFGAEEIPRVPEEGPAFYLGLRIGDTARSAAPPTTCRGDSASPTSRTPTATR